jgi:hypothetical protein
MSLFVKFGLDKVKQQHSQSLAEKNVLRGIPDAAKEILRLQGHGDTLVSLLERQVNYDVHFDHITLERKRESFRLQPGKIEITEEKKKKRVKKRKERDEDPTKPQQEE